MSGLLEGWDWFDNGLQNAVKAAGFRPLNKTQSMMVMYLFSGVQRPIEIARKMRLSRQAIRHISNELIQIGMVRARPDPSDGRSLILSFTTQSAKLRDYAEASIRHLESELIDRIGRRRFRILQETMNLDWGPVVNDFAEVNLDRRRTPRTRAHERTEAPSTGQATRKRRRATASTPD